MTRLTTLISVPIAALLAITATAKKDPPAASASPAPANWPVIGDHGTAQAPQGCNDAKNPGDCTTKNVKWGHPSAYVQNPKCEFNPDIMKRFLTVAQNQLTTAANDPTTALVSNWDVISDFISIYVHPTKSGITLDDMKTQLGFLLASVDQLKSEWQGNVYDLKNGGVLGTYGVGCGKLSNAGTQGSAQGAQAGAQGAQAGTQGTQSGSQGGMQGTAAMQGMQGMQGGAQGTH